MTSLRPPLAFEGAKRERVFLVPERWRAGRSALPASDPPGVRWAGRPFVAFPSTARPSWSTTGCMAGRCTARTGER